ncbi:hypothetical protein SLEP1_g34657 [Rubroshorea leprosula]|uniref:Sulfotransferase n=1 Tax=Rubroshorea leprosula TaxID=152421 RepID=A0AAV5KKQ6_9ROSI|nr:hypothetical protein SLEP1_g34657 [Rubroshorea leprosula]
MESPFAPPKNHFAANEKPPKSYRELVSTLPRTKGWNAKDDLYHYQGFWFYPTFLDGIMSAQDHFRAQPLDILICSTLRNGTTWLKALAFAIVTRNSFDDPTSPLLSTIPHECIPFVEMDLSHGSSARDPEMPLLSTHIPFSSLPKSVLESGAVEKIVKMCSFENLSNLEVNKTGKHRQDTQMPIQNNVFFWKGKIGDWKNYLTPEMAARLDRITEQKLGNSGLNLVRH